jgi:hypothetical protein
MVRWWVLRQNERKDNEKDVYPGRSTHRYPLWHLALPPWPICFVVGLGWGGLGREEACDQLVVPAHCGATRRFGSDMIAFALPFPFPWPPSDFADCDGPEGRMRSERRVPRGETHGVP